MELQLEEALRRIDTLEHRLNHCVSVLATFTGLRDAFIQGIAAIEDAQDWPYDRSALAKRREKVKLP